MEIKQLEERIKNLEQSSQHSKENNCNICNYKATSVNNLKLHIIKEHEQEKSRESSLCDSLQLSLHLEDRDEEFFDTPSSPHILSPASNPSHITKGQCTYPSCLQTACNFFKKTKLDISHIKYNGCKQISSYLNVFVCDLHIKFVPFQELRKNPPVIL